MTRAEIKSQIDFPIVVKPQGFDKTLEKFVCMHLPEELSSKQPSKYLVDEKKKRWWMPKKPHRTTISLINFEEGVCYEELRGWLDLFHFANAEETLVFISTYYDKLKRKLGKPNIIAPGAEWQFPQRKSQILNVETNFDAPWLTFDYIDRQWDWYHWFVFKP